MIPDPNANPNANPNADSNSDLSPDLNHDPSPHHPSPLTARNTEVAAGPRHLPRHLPQPHPPVGGVRG